ncbi:MAG: SgcJ/EcaC family oxidoreductase [Bryobacteraceae bacterium]|nr:SgcJ/EcaC family oxidoreductase [Bryobacteraceae bacterium]
MLAKLIALALFAVSLYPQAATDEQAVRRLIAAYVEAREQRDAQRLSALLTPDADQLVSSGEWRKGREELVKGMLASSQRNAGQRTIEIETVRFIAPGVALADGRYQIAAEPGGQARHMWTAFLLTRRDNTWRIAAIRNMLPASGR